MSVREKDGERVRDVLSLQDGNKNTTEAVL